MSNPQISQKPFKIIPVKNDKPNFLNSFTFESLSIVPRPHIQSKICGSFFIASPSVISFLLFQTQRIIAHLRTEKDDRSVGIVAGEALAISFEIRNLEKFSIQDVTHIQGASFWTVSRHHGVTINQFIWSSLSSWRSLLLMALLYDCSQLLFRENVAAWVCFYDRKDMFIKRVLYLKEPEYCREDKLTTSASLTPSSLEDDKVSKKVMRLASLHCWHSLSFGLFQAMHVFEVSSHKELSLAIGDYVVVRKFNKICEFHK
ncbi:hypothetical protein L1987_45543 [Smallanthus sonchifolius]|uniref:Uncharacterized protein n=1 Tax=Smallanthus sonchifolius TaxID=185202 RepID=A0ACB9FXC1_9ASTR|nr:hypothetical protein L1987_45543 [Smallanthus sonchifolius]